MSTSFTNLTGFSPDEFAAPPKERMSEREFFEWVRTNHPHAELVDHRAIPLAARHQAQRDLMFWLFDVVGMSVRKAGSGDVGFERFMRLGEGHIRRPDLFFVAHDRLEILQEKILFEPPDMVVEIATPDSAARDWREKYFAYEAFGIREYWVIDLGASSFEIYSRDEAGKYRHVDVVNGIFHSTVIPGLWMKAEWFAPTRPRSRYALAELGVI